MIMIYDCEYQWMFLLYYFYYCNVCVCWPKVCVAMGKHCMTVEGFMSTVDRVDPVWTAGGFWEKPEGGWDSWGIDQQQSRLNRPGACVGSSLKLVPIRRSPAEAVSSEAFGTSSDTKPRVPWHGPIGPWAPWIMGQWAHGSIEKKELHETSPDKKEKMT